MSWLDPRRTHDARGTGWLYFAYEELNRDKNAEKAAVNDIVDCFFVHWNVISYIVAEVYAGIRDP